ncbi:MAG: CARDB domain-containing protein [Promethearchaeota archaeon]
MKKRYLIVGILIFLWHPIFLAPDLLYLKNDDARLIVISDSNNNRDISINDWCPIEETLNLSSSSAQNYSLTTIEYDMNRKVETLVENSEIKESSSQLVVEPFEGILDVNYTDQSTHIEQDKIKSSYVFPPDDRQKVSATSTYPWRTICKLFITAQDNTQFIGSGAILDEFHVLTCGHCAYLHDYGGWAKQIEIVPGMNGISDPYGSAYVTYMRSYSGWTQDELPEHDWAVLTLDRSIGLFTGWMGRQTLDPSSSIYTGVLNTAGYPGDLDYGYYMYYTSDYGDRADEYNHWFWLDTAGGQSGSPIWRYNGTNRYILTILAYEYVGGVDANFGTRLNTNKFNSINTWLSEDSSSPPNDKPDLVDRDYYSAISTTSVFAEQTQFEIYCDVKNQGTATAISFKVEFYASTDGVISTSDYLIGSKTVTNLDGFDYSEADWSGLFPSNIPEGSYTLGWIIDAENNVDELDEGNNIVTINNVKLEVHKPIDYMPIIIGVVVAVSVLAVVAIIIVVKRIPDLRLEDFY